ncbi:hypothetical protein D3C81_972060 [compost metagenome]
MGGVLFGGVAAELDQVVVQLTYPVGNVLHGAAEHRLHLRYLVLLGQPLVLIEQHTVLVDQPLHLGKSRLARRRHYRTVALDTFVEQALEHLQARQGRRQLRGLAGNGHAQGDDAQAQHVAADFTQVAGANVGHLLGVHHGFAHAGDLVDGKQPEHHDQGGDQAETQVRAGSDVEMAQAHEDISGWQWDVLPITFGMQRTMLSG